MICRFDILTSLVASGLLSSVPTPTSGWSTSTSARTPTSRSTCWPVRVTPHEKASLALDAMLRVFPELETAPLFTELFLSGVVVLIENKLPITYLQRLFSDPVFRSECLKRLPHDELVQLTFRQLRAARPGSGRGGRLDRSGAPSSCPSTPPPVSRLGQPDNKLPLRQFMDEGRFLIFNLGGIRDELSPTDHRRHADGPARAGGALPDRPAAPGAGARTRCWSTSGRSSRPPRTRWATS